MSISGKDLADLRSPHLDVRCECIYFLYRYGLLIDVVDMEVYEYYPVSAMTFVYPDPQSSSNVTRGPDVATIRILSPNDFSDGSSFRTIVKDPCSKDLLLLVVFGHFYVGRSP